MNTQALAFYKGLYSPRSHGSRHRPFLQALEHIRYGRLALATPEGESLYFSAPAEGPAAHMKLYNWQAIDRFIAYGETGFAEGYIDGDWTSDDLTQLLTFGLMNAPSLERFFYGKPIYALMTYLRQLVSGNTPTASRRNVMAHYDLGNAFYSLWLDKSMTYSCGLFEGDTHRTLEEAQAAKYQRILGKLNAQPGDHILEIGCGWGGFAEAAAKQGIKVTAITLSPEQAHFARKRLRRAGLSELAAVELIDYRELNAQFDHIVSIGMFEHVGESYWRTYFDTIKKCLKPSGKAMVQSITLDDEIFEKHHNHVGFIERVIFPGGMLPSRRRFRNVATAAGLECREMFAFGKDYARTLTHWLQRFEDHKEEIRALGYDEAFIRLWRFYLSSCIASFASERTSVMQAELTHQA